MDWIIDNIGASIVSFAIGGLLTWLLAIRKNLKVYVHTLFRKDTDYRISAAYLFKIQIDNKYLLIKGNRSKINLANTDRGVNIKAPASLCMQ